MPLVHEPSPDARTGLLGPADVRALSDQLGIRPTKTLGQNFVHDAGTVRRIVRAAGVHSGESVLEVGPGLGSLTLALLEAGAHVVAVEIDPILAAALPSTVATRMPEAARRLTVIEADAMTMTSPAVIGGVEPLRLVANLPYNVAVPVLLTILEGLPTLRSVLVMVQAEVADRLGAQPGSRTYGVPSVKAAWYGSARRTITVGRSVFWPVPNVDSALVEILRRDAPTTSAPREDVFRVIDTAFSQRRKTLRKALAPLAGAPARAEAALIAAGVDPSARGETLDIVAFTRIAEALAALEPTGDALASATSVSTQNLAGE